MHDQIWRGSVTLTAKADARTRGELERCQLDVNWSQLLTEGSRSPVRWVWRGPLENTARLWKGGEDVTQQGVEKQRHKMRIGLSKLVGSGPKFSSAYFSCICIAPFTVKMASRCFTEIETQSRNPQVSTVVLCWGLQLPFWCSSVNLIYIEYNAHIKVWAVTKWMNDLKKNKKKKSVCSWARVGQTPGNFWGKLPGVSEGNETKKYKKKTKQKNSSFLDMIALKSADYRRADKSVHITHMPLNIAPNAAARVLMENIGTSSSKEISKVVVLDLEWI